MMRLHYLNKSNNKIKQRQLNLVLKKWSIQKQVVNALLQVGIAYKHLKAKLDKEKEEKNTKENSQKIKGHTEW